MRPFEAWTIESQLGYALKAYAYLPVTGVKRVLLGRNENSKEYFRNSWGKLPEELLQACRRQRVIWIEAQSMGEVGQIVSFCQKLKRILPDHVLILSTHDEASLTLARKRLPLAGSFYSPWDLPWVCRRVVRQIRPELLLYVEHVKSPVLLETAHQEGIKTALISGFFPSGWGENSYLKRPVARRFWDFLELAAVKEKEDAQTLCGFGMDPGRISIQGDLKFDASPIVVSEEKERQLREAFGQKEDLLFIAGSVHVNEIDFLAQAFLAARRSLESLKMILAPRWTEESCSIEAILAKYPLEVKRRSNLLSQGGFWKDILLLDTYGELASLYALSFAVFMGGSLPKENQAWNGLCHNMIEPLLHQKPIFFGTNTHYRKKLVNQLKEVWSRLEVRTPEELGEGMIRLAQDRSILEAVVEREREIVAAQSGVVSRYVSLIGNFLSSSFSEVDGSFHQPVEVKK